MISIHCNNNICSAKAQAQTKTMSKEQSTPILTPVKRPLETSINDVTPSPARKRLAPTPSNGPKSSSESQRFVLQRCHAWSEDSDEEAAIAQKSRKRARVSFNVPLLRKTMFYTASFSLVTPIHWDNLIPASDNLQDVLSRATQKERI